MRSEEGEGGGYCVKQRVLTKLWRFSPPEYCRCLLKGGGGGGGGGKGGHGHPRTPLTTPLRNLREFVATTPPPSPFHPLLSGMWLAY